MALVDQFGRPIRRERLKGEEAGAVPLFRPLTTSHPTQGLTPIRLAQLLLAAEHGDATGYLELAEEMEEKDLHYLSVLSTRKRAVAQLDITVEAATDHADDVAAADLVREFLRREELQDELFDIEDAIGKGYSVTEIVWDLSERQWWPRRLVWRDPRWFAYDRADGRTLRLRGQAGLEELSPWKYIIHEVSAKSGLPIRGGIARSVAWAFMFKTFTIKDWAVFLEVYGQPLRIGKYHKGASEEDRRVLLEAVSNIGADAGAIIPEDMRIEFADTKQGSSGDLYERRADWLDRQVSKAVLGQTLTTEVKGGSLAAAKVHDEVRRDIMNADARQLAATLNRDLVRPLIDLNMGPRDAYPRVVIGLPDVTDIAAYTKAVVELVDRGLEIEQSVARDKLGLPEPEPGAKLLQARAGGAAAPEAPEPPARPAAHQVARHAQAAADGDAIDDLVEDALRDWERLMAPMVEPIRDLIAECEDWDEVRDRLAEAVARMDTSHLRRSLSQAGFVARLAGALGVPASEDEERLGDGRDPV